MCGMTPAVGAGITPKPATSTQAGGATPPTTPAVTGGGATSSTISAALNQLVAAVEALKAVITKMSGAVAGGGAGAAELTNQLAKQVAGNNATQAAAGGMAGMDESMPHSHDMGAANGGKPTVLQGSAKELLTGPLISASNFANSTTTSSGKVVFGRTAPEDRAKAGAVVNKLISSTAKYADSNAAKAAGYDFDKFPVEGGGLVHAIKGGQNLDLDAPGMILYRKQADGSLKLIGAALGANGAAPDLGMGTWHVHGAGNINMMKHIWFTPNDLDTAFNETTPPASVI
ncbi:MAG: hypothetical protein JWN72_2211 [Thermoleophilia bacterium]|nr:hypothetical protein [Thermoleophilia bacterium]